MQTLKEGLAAGLQTLQIPATAAQQQQLLTFMELLEKWNGAFNLTALSTPEEMLTHHLLDSASVLPFIQGNHILDVGSGAGLPGLPLAVLRPDWRFTLLDSNGKKTRFMQQAVYELRLTNVTIVQGRIEQYRPANGFDTVISRAFSSLASFVKSCTAVCGPATRLLAMKGRQPQAELDELQGSGYRGEIHRLSVPGLTAERHLVFLQDSDETHD
jgi:16S rRNA (guanine527-N7)-methyltransferase